MVGVPVDAEGLVVDAIPADARLVYVTPSHQFPLGMPMSGARRRALLARAHAIGAIVVEDDYDSEFRYEGRPTDSLQGMDDTGNVALVGSFSKTVSPSLRLGYVIAPPAVAQAVANIKHLVDWHTPTQTQVALARFMADGDLQRHIRRCHAAYAERRERLRAASPTTSRRGSSWCPRRPASTWRRWRGARWTCRRCSTSRAASTWASIRWPASIASRRRATG